MIPYFIALVLIGLSMILTAPLLVLPNVTLPAFVGDAIITSGNALAAVGHVFPLFAAALIIAYTTKIVIENWHLIFKMIMWVKELVW
jgi:hypothetical protein